MKSLLLLAYSKNTLMNNPKMTKLVDRFSEGGNFFTLIKVQKFSERCHELGKLLHKTSYVTVRKS